MKVFKLSSAVKLSRDPRQYEGKDSHPTYTSSQKAAYLFNMSQSRGNGRVVARTLNVVQQPQKEASSTIHNPSTQLLARVPDEPASSSNGWRCAESVLLSNSKPVAQLVRSRLASAAGRQLLSSGQPVLLPHLQLATCRLNQQRQQAPPAASTNTRPLSVLCSPADCNRFIATEESKNVPGCYYNVRKPETSTMQMGFEEWMDCWRSWTRSRLLLQAHACNWELGDGGSLKLWPNTAVYPHLTRLLQVTSPSTSTSAAHCAARHAAAAVSDTHQRAVRNDAAAAAAAVGGGVTAPASSHGGQETAAAGQDVLDWCLLQQLLHSGQWAQRGSLHLLAGGSDALLPACYHTCDRVLCQVSGRQRLLLLPPDQAFKGLYPYPVHHPYDHYSAVDLEEPELEHFPEAAKLSGGLLCDLAPGDSLVVPAYWFVHAQLMQPACVSLELQLQPLSTGLRPPAALVLQLSRMMEGWFAAEVGPANVRRWFQALSEGREWQLLEQQLLTVKGYRLLQCSHMAMEQLQKVLWLQGSYDGSSSTDVTPDGALCSALQPVAPAGVAATAHSSSSSSRLECAARHLVGLMCRGRLVPTPWLNEGITDPLYLQHPPRYYLIEEDAEAVKYSSLFRHRLIANQSDWMQAATPMQLAPAGSRRSLVVKAAAVDGGGARTLPAAEQ